MIFNGMKVISNPMLTKAAVLGTDIQDIWPMSLKVEIKEVTIRTVVEG